MSPEVAAYLDKARQDLAEAHAIMGIRLFKVAARTAYYAVFHAAEALLLARTGRIAKSHAGLRSALAQSLRETPGDRDLLTFLARAYKLKEVGDYGVGLEAIITQAEAQELIAGSDHFLARVMALLDKSDGALGQGGDPT